MNDRDEEKSGWHNNKPFIMYLVCKGSPIALPTMLIESGYAYGVLVYTWYRCSPNAGSTTIIIGGGCAMDFSPKRSFILGQPIASFSDCALRPSLGENILYSNCFACCVRDFQVSTTEPPARPPRNSLSTAATAKPPSIGFYEYTSIVFR